MRRGDEDWLVPRTSDRHRSPDGSAQLLDADQVARGIPEGAVANAIDLGHRLLDDPGWSGRSSGGAIETDCLDLARGTDRLTHDLGALLR